MPVRGLVVYDSHCFLTALTGSVKVARIMSE